MDADLKRADSFFETAFDAAPDAILIFDDEGAYVYVNEAAAVLYSTTRTELLKHRIGDFTVDGEHDRLDRWWAELRREREVEGRHRVRDADGRERFVEFRTRADFLPGRHITVVRERSAARLRLSRREQEVMQLLARGMNGTAIGKELFISPETVRTHVRNAMDKLGARTRPHAIALAAAAGEIQLFED